MRTRLYGFFTVIFVQLLVCVGVASRVDPEHGKMMNCYQESVHARDEYTSNQWRVVSFPFDLNGDGTNELFVASPDNQSPRGNLWDLVCHSPVDHRQLRVMGTGLWGRDDQFYSIELSGTPRQLFGHQVMAYVDGAGRQHEQGDFLVRLDAKGRLFKTPIPDGLEKLFNNPAFKKLERIRVIRECGFHPGAVIRASSGRSILTKVNLEYNGGISRPARIDAFVESYRKSLKSRSIDTSPLTVLMIYFDADLDGDADFYVAAKWDSVPSSLYTWDLYLNDNGYFRKAEKTIWTSRQACRDLQTVEPHVVADRRAFYRILRSDTGPSFVVLGTQEGRLHSQTYFKYVESMKHVSSAADSQVLTGNHLSNDISVDDFEKRLGCAQPFDLTEIVTWGWFVRIERLMCEEFKEK